MRRIAAWVVLLSVCHLGASPLTHAMPSQEQKFVVPTGDAQIVRFERSDASMVEIVYDLKASHPDAVFTIKLEVSRDNGATFDLEAQSVTGDVGDHVAHGSGKRVLWNSAQDVERLPFEQLRFRIVATGVPIAIIEMPPVAAPEVVAAPTPTPVTTEAAPAETPKPVEPATNAPPVPSRVQRRGTNPLIWIGAGGAVAGGAALALGRGGSGGSESATTPPVTTPPVTTTAPPVTPVPPCSYALLPRMLTMPAAVSSATVTVAASAQDCRWTATSNSSFIAVSGAASITGSGTLQFTASANSTGIPRTGTLTIAGETVTVTQVQAGPDTLAFNFVSPAPGTTVKVGSVSQGAGVVASVRYFLGSRDSAWICVQPVGTNSAECGPRQVTRGGGSVDIRFSVNATAPNLPLTTTQLQVFMGDSNQFGPTTFLRAFEPALYVWVRP